MNIQFHAFIQQERQTITLPQHMNYENILHII